MAKPIPHHPMWRDSKIRLFLYSLRKQYGYSRAEAAKEIGYSIALLNAWEHGYQAPDFIQLTEWSSIFGMQLLLTPQIPNSKLSGPEHVLRAAIVGEQRGSN